MKNKGYILSSAALVGGLIFCLSIMHAQVPELTGQDVVPVFEGWEQNADGTYEMYFGYMNRNFAENLIIPIGADNSFSPGEPDRGQPTYFYPRRQMFLFHVQVPKDWGDKDLVWTLNSYGKTEKAYGHLLPVWLIDRRLISANVHGSSQLDVVDHDQPPNIELSPVPKTISLAAALTLTSSITDDGTPKPGERRRGLGRRGAAEQTFLNDPLPSEPRWPAGLSVRWMVYRGPGEVTFSPLGFQSVTAGKENVTKAVFSKPGTYVLQAVASDSVLETRRDINITVNAGAPGR